MNIRYYILSVLMLFGFSVTAHAVVTATLNRNAVSSGETIQLRIQRDGSADGQPDISPLRKDFDVLGSSSGSNVQIINGKMSTQTQITFLLSPKHDGKIQIPPLQWGNEQSAAIELIVGGNGGATQQGNAHPDSDSDHVYLTTTFDKIQPYVQAAVVLTLRLYTDQGLHQAALDFPTSSDVIIKQLGKDLQLNETRNGRNYQVIERKYLLFPQRSGKLSLDGPVLNAQVMDRNGNDPFDSLFRQMPFGGMLNSTRPIRVRAKSIELNVLPRPAGMNSTSWLPAQKVALDETTPQEKMTLHVGEPMTRHLKISALGLTGAQLPDPSTLLNMPEGLKAYPDQATLTDTPQSNSVLGIREQNIAMIANRPGHYELPPIRLNWWDTLRNERREITLPSRIVEVLPATGTSSTTRIPSAIEPAILADQTNPDSVTTQTTRAGNNPAWMWLSLTLGLLWVSTLAAWWYSIQHKTKFQPSKNDAKKTPSRIHESTEIKAINRACSENDPHAARQHLLKWASKFWPDNPPHGLNELSRYFDDDAFIDALRQLDKACYSSSLWRGENLAQSLPATLKPDDAHKEKSNLPALYE